MMKYALTLFFMAYSVYATQNCETLKKSVGVKISDLLSGFVNINSILKSVSLTTSVVFANEDIPRNILGEKDEVFTREFWEHMEAEVEYSSKFPDAHDFVQYLIFKGKQIVLRVKAQFDEITLNHLDEAPYFLENCLKRGRLNPAGASIINN